jgi:hypothetical protein
MARAATPAELRPRTAVASPYNSIRVAIEMMLAASIHILPA